MLITLKYRDNERKKGQKLGWPYHFQSHQNYTQNDSQLNFLLSINLRMAKVHFEAFAVVIHQVSAELLRF